MIPEETTASIIGLSGLSFTPVVGAFSPDFSSVDHPSIAHLPRSALGFFVFRHFGFQVSLCINSAKYSMTSSKAGKAG
jgi:hypothetical protein